MNPSPESHRAAFEGFVPRAVGFIALELAFLGAVNVLGGPNWGALGVLACVAQILGDFRVHSLAFLAPAVLWAAAYRATGDRELFFPYAIFLAAQAAGPFAIRSRTATVLAAGTIAAAFLAVRVAQGATRRVLAVEVVVTLLILGAVVALLPAAGRRRLAVTALAVLASIAAYASLAL